MTRRHPKMPSPQRHRMVQLAETIIAHSPAILFRRIAGDDPRLVYVSPNISRLGYTADAFLKGEIHFKDIVHPDDSERVSREIRDHTEAASEKYTQVYRVLTRDGDVRWVEDRTSVVEDPETGERYNQGLVVDITRRMRVEIQLRKSEEKYRRIVETAGEGFLLMDTDLSITDVNHALCRLSGYSREDLIGQTPLERVTPEYAQYMKTHREALLGQDYRETEGNVLTRDGRSVPVLIHGNTLRDDNGAIIGHMAFITDMREHKKALALAGEVQKSLLPRSGPQIEGLDIAGRSISCDEIGGDYFDFIWKQTSRSGPCSIVVGDITGHGVDSALLMTTARAFLRMRASQEDDIAGIVGAMNRHLAADVQDTGRFMTLFYLKVDKTADRIEWVRAGHEPAMMFDPASNQFETLKGRGLPLGIDPDTAYRVNTRVGLKPGQLIAVATDGVWETRNRHEDMFGRERFQQVLRAHADRSAEAIVNAVFAELARFASGIKTEDDITLVILKITQ